MWLTFCCACAAQGARDDSLEAPTQPSEGLSAELHRLLASAAPSPERLAGSAASEPDVAHLLLEAAREANLELVHDAETDANMLEVWSVHIVGPDIVSVLLHGNYRPSFLYSGPLCCGASSKKAAV